MFVCDLGTFGMCRSIDFHNIVMNGFLGRYKVKRW